MPWQRVSLHENQANNKSAVFLERKVMLQVTLAMIIINALWYMVRTHAR